MFKSGFLPHEKKKYGSYQELESYESTHHLLQGSQSDKNVVACQRVKGKEGDTKKIVN